MNLSPIAYRLAELLHAEGATDLLAGSDETKDAATRAYFGALSPRDRTDEMVEAISERLNASAVLTAIGDDTALGALIAGDLYLHAESQLREPVAAALAVLQKDLNISKAVDQAIDQIKERSAA